MLKTFCWIALGLLSAFSGFWALLIGLSTLGDFTRVAASLYSHGSIVPPELADVASAYFLRLITGPIMCGTLSLVAYLSARRAIRLKVRN